MSILTRYVIRAHVGPFLFAFSAVTGLLFLNAVAQRLENLAGKGLGPEIIGEFMLLSLPHIVALTFPMAILVSVLYAFSDMTAQNEMSAMAAGGVRASRFLFPLLAVGAVLSLVMFFFNARVLPESNHRLSSLLSDVGSKSPTFELREQVVNEVHTGDNTRYYLRAARIDQATNTMQDVVIYDLSRMGENRTIVAQRAEMAFTPDQADLFLTLHDGTVYDVTDERPGGFQRMDFEEQILPLRGVGMELERRTRGGARGDREMTIPMLRDRVAENLENLHTISDESSRGSLDMVRAALSLDRAPAEDDQLPAGFAPPAMGSDPEVENVRSMHSINNTRWGVHRLQTYRYRVEIHKKYAIAFACMVFILLGAPFAIRFPQGGVGMVIATSVFIFFFYWMGLIGGERLADRGMMDPVLAMWLPNAILLAPAIPLALRMGSRISTNRGGGWGAVFRAIRVSLRLPRAGHRASAVPSVQEG